MTITDRHQYRSENYPRWNPSSPLLAVDFYVKVEPVLCNPTLGDEKNPSQVVNLNQYHLISFDKFGIYWHVDQ